MKNNWVQSNNAFFLREVSTQIPKLQPHIYKVSCTPMGELFLEMIKEQFEFPYKIYGLETNFIKRVQTTYENTKSNLGVLMNGIRGTGKTVTAEIIANNFQGLLMPTILVNMNFPGLVNFLSSIQQDVVLLFDEFEKVFPSRFHNDEEPEGPNGGASLLTIMDGTLSGKHRKVFLLTTNRLYVEQNLIQRPSRIRYLKTFGNLNKEAIFEIVDDKLIHKQLRNDVVEFIAQLELITVDIVSQVIQEVNIHNEEPEDFADIFNVKKICKYYDIYEIIPAKGKRKASEKLIYKRVLVPIAEALQTAENAENNWLQAGSKNLGMILSYEGLEDVEVVVFPHNVGDEKAPRKHYKVEKCYSYNNTFSTGLFK